MVFYKKNRLDLLIHSIKSNSDCKPERKQFNLCRANLLGKYVEPSFCLENANSLINCFQTTYYYFLLSPPPSPPPPSPRLLIFHSFYRRKDNSNSCKNSFKAVFECAKNYDNAGRFSFPSSCDKELTAYLEC